MTCPACGYMMTAFDKDCPRCERIGKPQKSCLKCGTSAAVKEEVCPRCRHRFGEPVEIPESVAAPSLPDIGTLDRETVRQIAQEVVAASGQAAGMPVVQSRPVNSHPGRICVMWFLTAIAWMAFLGGAAAVGVLIDLAAVIVAITLAASASSTDKSNGWIKLSLEIVAFFVAFASSASQPQS